MVGTAGSISSDAKRLLTDLEVPNPTGELSSGSYVQITLDIPIDDRGVILPAETLLFTSRKASVGVMRPNETVEIGTIAVSRDLGSKLEIS